MKLVTFTSGSKTSWGVLQDDRIADVGAVLVNYPDLKALIAADAFQEAADAVAGAALLPLADVKLQPVIPNPGKILCVGHNYESHRQETGRDKTEYPSIFNRYADSQVGHLSPLVRPAVSTMFDYEGELAIVIGKGGRNIPVESALDHIAGYSCYMDASVRDWQWHTRQFLPGKTFPGTGGFGPCLVTADELPDPTTTSVTTRLNGEIVQSQPTSDMIFTLPVIINYVSTFTPLSAGDVIVTGTPGGVGAKRQPPLWLKAGDRVEVDIPGVGLLVNEVIDEV
jgi:2-keto-4-pentenoate hydratase/2-oxohepta-3-ene-1,7-dioic acid hydratase in catechol pathway